jgi:hypothetical protein
MSVESRLCSRRRIDCTDYCETAEGSTGTVVRHTVRQATHEEEQVKPFTVSREPHASLDEASSKDPDLTHLHRPLAALPCRVHREVSGGRSPNRSIEPTRNFAAPTDGLY